MSDLNRQRRKPQRREVSWAEVVAAFDAAFGHIVTTPAPREEKPAPMPRPALLRFHAAKRRTAKMQRTPPWADLDAMRAIYAEAQRLTRETGIQHHVDHVYPLQGEFVSGLHVAGNLQILTGSENSRKRNHFEPC